MKDIVVKNDRGENITVSVIGFFEIPDLEKTYVMYSMIDDNPNNTEGLVLLGEVVMEDGKPAQILGIKSSEKELVVAYYNEISNQIGGE